MKLVGWWQTRRKAQPGEERENGERVWRPEQLTAYTALSENLFGS